MWKLFATVVALSDTGSISVALSESTFASRQSCEAAIAQLFTQPGQHEQDGHRYTVRPNAKCLPDGPPPGQPPAVIFNPFAFFPR